MNRFLVYAESSGKSSHNKHMRSVSCEYEFILYACIFPMLMLWIIYTEGYISKVKVVWSAACWDKHDKTLEARFLGKDSMVFKVWYYCCAHVVYVVHVVSMILCACHVVYT